MDKFQIAIKTIIDELKTSQELQTWAKQYGMEDDPYLVMRLFELLCSEIQQGEDERRMSVDPECESFLQQSKEDWESLVDTLHNPQASVTNAQYTSLANCCLEDWDTDMGGGKEFTLYILWESFPTNSGPQQS
jgi:hypothetical protein